MGNSEVFGGLSAKGPPPAFRPRPSAQARLWARGSQVYRERAAEQRSRAKPVRTPRTRECEVEAVFTRFQGDAGGPRFAERLEERGLAACVPGVPMKTHLKPKLEVKKLVVRKNVLRELSSQNLSQVLGGYAGTLSPSSKCSR